MIEAVSACGCSCTAPSTATRGRVTCMEAPRSIASSSGTAGMPAVCHRSGNDPDSARAMNSGTGADLHRYETEHRLGGRPDRHRLPDGRARHAGRVDGAEHDPRRSRRLRGGAGVDRQRLQPELRRAADHGRRARRPLRPPPLLRGRPGAVHRRLGAVRARTRRRLADRRPRRPGRGRRAADAARPGAAERRLPARAPRRGDRDLQRDHRPLRRRGPARRRRGRRGPRLGVDLLAQRADRRGRDPARADAHAREPRARRRARPPRARARDRRRARDRLGPGARQRGRVGERGGARLARRRRRARGGVRGLGAARPRPDAAAGPVPLARLRGEQRRDVLHLRVAVQRRLLLSRSCSRPGSATGRWRPACG